MTLFYFSATVQTVVPIVKQGAFQDSNDARYLSCFRNSADCLQNCKETFNNVFLVLFDIPNGYQSESMNYIYDEDDDNDKDKECMLITKYIDPRWVRKIVVYSRDAEVGLMKLFNQTDSVTIQINANVFSDNVALTQDLRYLEDYESSDDEGVISQYSTPMDIASKSDSSSDSQLPVVFFRLTTNGEHIDILKDEIRTASKKVLITTYDINEYVFKKYNLYGIFAEAVRRGVKFYIYYNDVNSLTQNLRAFFNAHNIKYDEARTHSKLLLIDDVTIMIGSYNWLSTPHRDSINGTIFYLGNDGCDLSEILWDHLRRYRALQYGQFWSVRRFDRENDQSTCFEFDLPESSKMTYLPTLEAHQDFLLSLFERAKDRVIICSPFISLSFLEEINHETLVQAAAKGVKTYFVSTPKAIEEAGFYDFLVECNLPNLFLVPVKNFHLKTIILDHDEIAEGSFNWLSASRDRSSDWHNHEASMVVNGPIAVEMIGEFFQTRIGQEILNNSVQVEYNEKSLFEQCRLQ